MKVCGLISGGKDSCFNLIQCLLHGHEIVCLAHMAPQSIPSSTVEEYGQPVEELDSFCFQTIGSNIVTKCYAECTGLPLLVHYYDGTAVQQQVEYDHHHHQHHQQQSEKKDEIEHLYDLLEKVKKEYPQVEAISSGAILSDYQRNRIENVCSRLQLISLAYLWRSDQSELLEKMMAFGEEYDNSFEVILVKTAVMGLHPKQFCGKSLLQRETITALHRNVIPMNVCGEGGEYETLVLQCPLLFKRKKIVIDKAHVVCSKKDDTIAPIGYYVIDEYHLEPIEQLSLSSVTTTVASATTTSANSLVYIPSSNMDTLNSLGLDISKVQVIHHLQTCSYSILKLGIPNYCNNTYQCMQAIMEYIKPNTKQIIHTFLIVKNMNTFVQVNSAYGNYFPFKPPSRVTIEDANQEYEIMVEFIIVKNSKQVTWLHVQSISDWCPACIGPYSQATRDANGIIRCAGQIGLIPHSMMLANGLESQFKQCMKNIKALLEAFRSHCKHIFRFVIFYDKKSCNLEELQKLSAIYCKEISSTKLIIWEPCTALPKNALVEFYVHSVSMDDLSFIHNSDDENKKCQVKLEANGTVHVQQYDFIYAKNNNNSVELDVKTIWNKWNDGSKEYIQ